MIRLSRRHLLAGASGFAVGCAAGSPGSDRPGGGDGPDPDTDTTGDTGTPDTGTPSGRPPIVYVYVDQLRFDALRITGNPIAVTPNLDAFAAEAVKFTTCVTNGPSCRAARTTMITGLHVFEHKVFDNVILPDPSLQSHVRQLRDVAGYHAMVVGKTHLHDGRGHFDDHKDLLVAWGFTDAVELPDPQQWNYESAHSDWLTASTPAGEPDKYTRWQDYILGYQWDSAPPDAAPWGLSTFDHLDSFCGRTAAEFVRSYQEDAPLYLQVCFPGPHKPFDPTSEWLARYDVNDPAMPLAILAPPTEPIAPLTQTYLGVKFETWDEPTARALRAHYYAKVSMVDAGIGELFQALRDAGLYDAAWIIVHSDHGELIADHQMTGKVLGYEGSIRVPLLIKPPGGVAGGGWQDVGQVDQRDVTATILAIGGLDPTGFGDRSLVDRVLG
ncbi:MAG: sulfatase-like hydrolase/transferase, partial [Myxococcota bacterium]